MALSFKTIAAVGILLTASGCVTSGGQSAAERTPDQNFIHDYTPEYSVVAGIAGGVAGCLVGILVVENRALGCVAGGIAGAGLGAASGYYFAKQQNQAGMAQAGLMLDHTKLHKDVTDAAKLTAASRNVTDTAKAEIADLQQQLASGKTSKSQLESRIRQADADRLAMTKASGHLEEKIKILATDGQRRELSKTERDILAEKRELLMAEKQALDVAIADLAGVTGALPGKSMAGSGNPTS